MGGDTETVTVGRRTLWLSTKNVNSREEAGTHLRHHVTEACLLHEEPDLIGISSNYQI